MTFSTTITLNKSILDLNPALDLNYTVDYPEHLSSPSSSFSCSRRSFDLYYISDMSSANKPIFTKDIELPSIHSILGDILQEQSPISKQATIVDKTFNERECSFINIIGEKIVKRPRRKYHEVNRKYHCNYPYCTRSYGALNHLNAHIKMFNHGPKRKAKEFKA